MNIGEPARSAVPALFERLADSQIEVRAKAGVALVKLAPEKRTDIVPLLAKTLVDVEDDNLRESIILALGDCEAEAGATVNLLLDMCNQKHHGVMSAAAATVARIQPGHADTLVAKD